MDDTIKIIKSLEDSSALIHGVTETVRHEIKIQEAGFLDTLSAPMTATLIQTVASSFVKGVIGKTITGAGRGVMRTGR